MIRNSSAYYLTESTTSHNKINTAPLSVVDGKYCTNFIKGISDYNKHLLCFYILLITTNYGKLLVIKINNEVHLKRTLI